MAKTKKATKAKRKTKSKEAKVAPKQQTYSEIVAKLRAGNMVFLAHQLDAAVEQALKAQPLLYTTREYAQTVFAGLVNARMEHMPEAREVLTAYVAWRLRGVK